MELGDDGEAGRLLASLARRHALSLDAAAGQLLDAATWADLHPMVDPEWQACLWDHVLHRRLPLAGEGTPGVDARCVAELAAVLQLGTQGGLRLISHALELRHRLPRLWAAMLDGQVPAWRARQVAEQTLELSIDAAAFVDRQVVAVAGRVTASALFRLVEAAMAEFMPERLAERRARMAEQRRVVLDLDGPGGVGHLYGCLDLDDAVDLDAAVTAGADQLARLGVTEPTQVRRAMALGDLARQQPTLPHPDPEPTVDAEPEPAPEPEPAAAPDGGADGGAGRPRASGHGRTIDLRVHLSADALTGGSGVATLERHGDQLISVELVRAWCGRPDAQVVVRPVVDLNCPPAEFAGYQVPDRLVEYVRLRDRCCVFPWCTNRRTDVDHLVPWARGGPTAVANLALLCRQHHRLKTHTRWSYRRDGPDRYVWTSPHGQRYLRDLAGTHRIG